MVTGRDRPRGRKDRALGLAVYLVLFVLGIVEGLVGSFQYGQPPVPLAAILLAVLVGVTCVFGGWGADSLGGSFVVAAGWLLASFILSLGSHEGSVIIANTSAGQWYLYGGTLAAALGVLATFILQATTRLMSTR
ncbi:MAG TPA: DUF6113 family protein [Trebonia sp.]|nr:DUF6113 family protein [Trebonia sp.]